MAYLCVVHAKASASLPWIVGVLQPGIQQQVNPGNKSKPDFFPVLPCCSSQNACVTTLELALVEICVEGWLG